MAKKATTDRKTKSAVSPTIKPVIHPTIKPAVTPAVHVDARITVGMFFTLTGAILSAFGLSTRNRVDVYAKSLGIDANLWWGLALLVFGIVMLAFGRRGQARMEKDHAVTPEKPELRLPR
jgi:hypothetical protein